MIITRSSFCCSCYFRSKTLTSTLESRLPRCTIDLATNRCCTRFSGRTQSSWRMPVMVQVDLITSCANPTAAAKQVFLAGYMTTEASSKFRGQPNDSSLPTFMSVGGKEFSGFTHNKNIEPVSFHPEYAHSGDHPGNMTTAVRLSFEIETTGSINEAFVRF